MYLVLADHLMFTNGIELTSRWGAAQPDVDLFNVARSIHLNETLDLAESQDTEPPSARDARRKFIGGAVVAVSTKSSAVEAFSESTHTWSTVKRRKLDEYWPCCPKNPLATACSGGFADGI